MEWVGLIIQCHHNCYQVPLEATAFINPLIAYTAKMVSFKAE